MKPDSTVLFLVGAPVAGYLWSCRDSTTGGAPGVSPGRSCSSACGARTSWVEPAGRELLFAN
jgi:hypothetical protein